MTSRTTIPGLVNVGDGGEAGVGVELNDVFVTEGNRRFLIRAIALWATSASDDLATDSTTCSPT
jgi:hypothetical protein